MRRCRRFARPGVRCRCRRARSCRYRAAPRDAAPRRRRALAATRGRACALARRHFRVPWVLPVVPCSVPACSSPGSGCSRSVPGQPPPRLGAAMPVAAAAPLISSVQKLVLYETRAVSSVPPAAAAAGPGAVISVPPAAVAQRGRGVQTLPACWLGPARSCCLGWVASCQKLRLTFLFVCWDLVLFGHTFKTSQELRKKNVLKLLFSRCLCLVT